MGAGGRETESGRAGRVGRPRSLTTGEVITVAIKIADEDGLEGLSMPKLARRLGVGTMTVYGYVANKRDLHDKIAAKIFTGLSVSKSGDWQEAMVRFFCDFREAALAHPALAGLLATGRVTIPAVFDILESLFERATSDGVPIEDAVRTFYAGLAYTLGFVLWEVPRAHLQPEENYAGQWSDLIGHLDPSGYPELVASATGAVVATVASAEQFAWGLGRIVGQPGTRHG